MREITEIFIRGVFFFIVGTVFLTLFIWSLVQGVLMHGTAQYMAMAYYFASVLAGVGGVVLYHQAKYSLHYAQIAK